MKLKCSSIKLTKWQKMVESIIHPKKSIKIALVGKYVQHQDAYKSIFESLLHAGSFLDTKVEIIKIEPEKISQDKNSLNILKQCSGILVPGGFGERGVLGKILATKFAREKKIPLFGICLGMQVLAIEFARNVLKLEDANSTEIEPSTTNPVISLLEDQKEIEKLGGSMRLG